jgi:hypothetical protein
MPRTFRIYEEARYDVTVPDDATAQDALEAYLEGIQAPFPCTVTERLVTELLPNGDELPREVTDP